MSRDLVHTVVTMLAGFALGCTLIHVTGGRPLAVLRPSVDMSALPMRSSLASPSKFMAPMQQSNARYSVKPVRASMPQQEEYAVAAAEKSGRREIMGKFARAAAVGAAAVATKNQVALADEEEEADTPAPGAGKKFDGPKLGAIAAVPAVAVGWVGFNILGPAFDQFGFMQEEKERKDAAAYGGKKTPMNVRAPQRQRDNL